MRLLAFIAITLLAGAASGTAYGGLNLLAIEPFVDEAIAIEVQNQIDEGEEVDMSEIESYRLWQKGGEVLAGTILGLSFGSFFALVYGFTRNSLAGSNDMKKGLFLASVIWLTIFLVPFLKYPANPPVVGDPETIYYRQSLYIAFIAISGLGALGFAFLYRRLSRVGARKIIVPLLYVAYVTGFYFAMPANPDPIPVPMELVNSFRIASATTALAFWMILGALFGALWHRFRLHIGMRKPAEQ